MGLFSRHPSSDDSIDNDTTLTDEDDHDERHWLRHRYVAWAGLAVLVVVIAFGCWLGLSALAAKTNLEQARTSAQQTKDALLQGNTADASRFAADGQSHAQAAHDATHSLPWNIASAVPWLGSPFKTGQQISDVVLGLTADVLKPTADAGTTVAPDQLFANGRLDVEALRNEEPALSKIAAAAARLNADAQAIPDPRYLSVLGEARSQLQAQTSDIAQLMGNTALAARLAPSMMGADGPRTYFMGFQTNAEARGTGGLLGGFGILRFDDGKATVDTLGPNTELDKPLHPTGPGPRIQPAVRVHQPHAPTSGTAIRVPTSPTRPKSGSRCGPNSPERTSTASSPSTRRPELHPRRDRTGHHARRRRRSPTTTSSN